MIRLWFIVMGLLVMALSALFNWGQYHTTGQNSIIASVGLVVGLFIALTAIVSER